MPTSVRDIAYLALRKLGVLRAGGEASAADMADASASLSSYYMECINAGTFGKVWNLPLTRDGASTAGVNTHINVLTDEGVTITLPSTVAWDWWGPTYYPYGDYGWPLPAAYYGAENVVMPQDRAVVQVTYQSAAPDAAIRSTYVYDAPVQRWLRIDTLEDTDEAPLSARGPDGLASVLAVRLADQFGAELLSPGTIQAANRYKLSLVSHHGEGDNYCC